MSGYHQLGLAERRIVNRLLQTGRSVKQATMELGSLDALRLTSTDANQPRPASHPNIIIGLSTSSLNTLMN